MGVIWEFVLDVEDFNKRVHREIKQSETIIAISNFRQELHETISQVQVNLRTELHTLLQDSERNFQSDFQSIGREILLLKQELHEEISRLKIDVDTKLNSRFREIESKIQNPPNVNLTPLHNELKQLRAENQRLASRVNQLEKMPAIDSTPLHEALEQLHAENQQLTARIDQLEKKTTSAPQQIITPSSQVAALQPQVVSLARTVEKLQQRLDLQSKNFESIKVDNNALKQLQAENQRLAARVNQLEERPPVITSSSQVAALQKQITPLAQIVENIHQRLALQSKNFESLQADNTALKQRCEVLEHIIADFIQPPIEPPTGPQLWISDFSIPRAENPSVYFDDDAASDKTKLSQSIQELDNLITYLNHSEIEEPAKTSFAKNLRSCMKDLEKFYTKFDFARCDEDELSEKLTEKFFKIISNSLLDNVVMAIYRGGAKARGYKDFLRKVNGYLTKHGIYTQEILPGMFVEGDILARIEPPIAKKTTVKADDGKIDEVELLPYFMSYNEDGNIETILKRGKVVPLKYGV